MAQTTHFGILIGNAKLPFQKTQFTPPPAVNKNNYFPKFLSTLILFQCCTNVMVEKCLLICISLIIIEVKEYFHMFVGYLLVLFCDFAYSYNLSVPIRLFDLLLNYVVWI